MPSLLGPKGHVFNLLSYGENYVRPKGSIHAEQDCINKLPSLEKNSKVKKVTLVSIRVNRSGQIVNGKPCFRCIYNMNSAIKKGYRITEVYYSDCDGNIIRCSLNELNREENKHRSGLYRF